MRRLALYILIAIAFISCELEKRNVESVQAIPTDAIAIVRVNDLTEFQQGIQASQLWEKIDSSNTVLQWTSDVAFYQEKVLAGKAVNFPFFVSAHRSGAGSYDMLLSANEKDLISIFTDNSFLQNLPSPTIRTYDGIDISTFDVDGISFTTARIQNVFLLSSSNLLVEKAVRQIKSEISLLSNAVFNDVYQSANRKDPMNLWVQYSHTDEYLDGRMNEVKVTWSGNIALWTELDITTREKGLLMSGITSYSDSVPSLIGMLNNNPAQEIELMEYMPANTAAFVAIGFENHATFRREYKKYLTFYNLENNLEKAEQNKDLTDGFYGWVDNQMAVFVTESPDGNPEEQTYAVIKSRDSDIAAEHLRKVSDITVEETYEGYTISQISANAMSVYYGELFHYLRKPYYTFIRNYVVFAQSKTALRVLINDFEFGRTLQSRAHFEELATSLNNRSNALIYFDLSKSITSFDRIIGESLQDEIQNAEELLNGLGYLMIQVETKDNFAYTNAILQTVEEKSADATTYWTVQLDTTLLFGPVPVVNHMTQQKEVLAQDINNQLYLISTDGRILWKKAIDGPIQGEIHQIDGYRNDKLQYVFNTVNKVYFVDRNGDDVAAFPIDLPATATAPMAVLDYDNSRNYRLLVPCGNQLYNYDIDGVEVSGWEYKKEKGNIVAQPQLFQVGNMDFIFIRHDENRVRALNRKGQNRLTFDPEDEISSNRFYLIRGSSVQDSRVVTTSIDGKLMSFFLGETMDVTPLENLSNEHQFGYYEEHFVLADEGFFAVKGPKYTYVVEDLEHPYAPKDYRFSDDLRFGVTAPTQNMFVLYDPSGSVSPGFPVRGDRPTFITDLERNGQLKIITGESEGYVHVYSLDW
jgi:hypothetical protein